MPEQCVLVRTGGDAADRVDQVGQGFVHVRLAHQLGAHIGVGIVQAAQLEHRPADVDVQPQTFQRVRYTFKRVWRSFQYRWRLSLILALGGRRGRFGV